MRKWDALVRGENLLKYVFGGANEAARRQRVAFRSYGSPTWRRSPPLRRTNADTAVAGYLHVRLGERAGAPRVLVDEHAGYRGDW